MNTSIYPISLFDLPWVMIPVAIVILIYIMRYSPMMMYRTFLNLR